MSDVVSKRRRRFRIGPLVAHTLLLAFVFVPILWGIRTSLSASNYDLAIVPEETTFGNYARMLTNSSILTSLGNTVVYALGTIALLLIVIIPAAYALARLRFRGRALGNVLLVLPLLPFIALLVPLVTSLNSMDLMNSRWSVVLITTVFQVPFTCWLLRNFFQAIPVSVEEAAFIDGCSRLRTLWSVVLPNSLTGIAAIVVYSFISTWLSYLVPYALVSYPELFSLSQTLLMFQGQYGTDYPALTAASIITILPPMLFFVVFQRWFIAGLFGFASK